MKTETNKTIVAMKTWKIVMICALCVLSVACLGFVGLVIKVYYDRTHPYHSCTPASVNVSENIVMEYVKKYGHERARLKDIQTGKYTTPQLQHVFINVYNSKDSLVVFRSLDHQRGYVNIRTGRIVVPAQYDRAWNFSEGMAAVLHDGVISFINVDGKTALPVEYDEIREASDHQGLVLIKGGYAKEVDKNLNTIVPFVHDGLHLLRYVDEYNYPDEEIFGKKRAQSPRYWRYTLGMNNGVIDDEGRVIIPAIYENVRMVNDEMFEAAVDYYGDHILFDAKGRVIGKANM